MYGVNTYTDYVYGEVKTTPVSTSLLSSYKINKVIAREFASNYKIWGGSVTDIDYGLGGYCKESTAVNYNLLSVRKLFKCEYVMGGKMLSPNAIIYSIDYRVSNVPFSLTWQIDPSDGMIVDRNKTSISTFSRTFTL